MTVKHVDHTCDQQVAPERPQVFLCTDFSPSITGMVETRHWMATVAREIIQWSNEFCLKPGTDCSILPDCCLTFFLGAKMTQTELRQFHLMFIRRGVTCSSQTQQRGIQKKATQGSFTSNEKKKLLFVWWTFILVIALFSNCFTSWQQCKKNTLPFYHNCFVVF